MTGGYWPDIFAGAAIIMVFTAFWAMWRTGYKDGFEAGQLAERNKRSTAAISRRQAASAWDQWEAELRMTQPIVHGGHRTIAAGDRRPLPAAPERRPYGAHAVTAPRNTRTTLIGSGVTAPTVSGAMRALEARADKFITDMAAAEDDYRRRNST